MISMIVAASKNGVIGKDNKLPWDKIKEDMNFFKFITTGQIVVMGRKTYESIGKALPNRRNIVLSKSLKQEQFDNVEVINSIDQVLEMNRRDPSNEIIIIGGEEIYKQFMDYADRVYLTIINDIIEGDAHFEMNYCNWRDVFERTIKSDKYLLTFKIKDRQTVSKLLDY